MKIRFQIALIMLALPLVMAGCQGGEDSADTDTAGLSPPDTSTTSLRGGNNDSCTDLRSGEIHSTQGTDDVLRLGYDEFGYNYQAHMYVGDYDGFDRLWGNGDSTIRLMMDWSDSWLSNKDCDGDGLLDRHRGTPAYIGSGAWLTNHESGPTPDGGTYSYFIKIVAAPADATAAGGVWHDAGGVEIGAQIWDSFAIIQEVYTDSSEGAHGILYNSPVNPGLGNW